MMGFHVRSSGVRDFWVTKYFNQLKLWHEKSKIQLRISLKSLLGSHGGLGALLAFVSYVGLHSVVLKGLPKASGADISGAMYGSMLYGGATIGQYLLPIVFVIGAVVSIVGKARRKKLYGDVSNGNRAVSDVSWQDFELLIGEHFRRQGYQVEETGSGADGGVDLVIRKSDEKYLVQCKHWKSYKVGVKPVRELLGIMASCAAAGGYFVTSGEFTGDARRFARENHIQLIDGISLNKIMADRKEGSAVQTFPDKVIPIVNTNKKEQPSCPKCGSQMVLRVAKSGKNAGQKFWGCAAFPKCRTIMPIK